MTLAPPIIVAAEDRLQLVQILAQAPGAAAGPQLDTELERARIVPLSEVPADVVVMNSEVEYEDETTHRRRRLRLVYPKDADSNAGRVSVLAPLGCALLGLRAKQAIDWDMPGGPRRLRVISVTRASPSAQSWAADMAGRLL
jgi:regulator of nucleoside diphosphate kinase